MKEPLKTSGTCPQCLLYGCYPELKLNSSEYFECPECGLQIKNFPELRLAGILNFRGKQSLKDFNTPASEILNDSFLCAVVHNPNTGSLAPGEFFYGEAELKDYLTRIAE